MYYLKKDSIDSDNDKKFSESPKLTLLERAKQSKFE